MYRPVHFKSVLAQEWLDPANEELGPGGHELASLIANGLAEFATDVSSVDQHEFYGWGFYSRIGSFAFYHVLHPSDGEATLTTSMNFYAWNFLLLRRPRSSFDQYCASIETVLDGLKPVSNIE